MKHTTLRADALLLLAAALWGGAFVAQRAAMQHLGPLTFNAIRFAIGSLVLLPVIAARSRRVPATAQPNGSSDAGNRHLYVVVGALAGLVMFVAATLQQAGMVYTTAAKGGFITGLYLPLVPIFGLFIGQRTGAATWFGAGMAVVGLYYLSIPNAAVGAMEVNRGDVLVLVCAVVWAVHVLVIGRFAPHTDPVKLAFAQFAVVAIASLIAAVVTERITVEALRAAIWAILYGGFVSVGIAFTLQVVGQRNAPPGHAALLLSLETVFAGFAGYLLLGERFGPRELFGAAVMFGGMLVSQVSRLLPSGAELPQVVSDGEGL